ncbi:hypothetical protein M407DRAFT_240477 [Tulasnella calospora MUT 4182]|uniref:Uncharacterized protein n=1 Tax=Tulasnella calospora MUT 4182 TaxID=1051891 RepID=A0A0C3MLQ7_9AGAM|nr:hypothetical protein M407DRAFT_240477 [Tulasnella calospora MUT 4182]
MPASSPTSPFFSSSRNNSQSSFRIPTLNDTLAMDALDAKARIEYERERQKAHKSHDVRRKHSGLSIKSNHSATTAHKRPGAALAHGNRRNPKITRDEMEDYDYAMTDADEDRFGNKENSRPPSRPVSVSLEDLVIWPSAPSGKKLRESVSRTSLSRQASTDNLTAALANVSLITAQSALPSISELHSRSPSSDSDSDSDSSILLSPMLPPSDYDSSTDDDLDDFDLQLDFPSFDEFSSPEVWTVAEAEDGAPQFRVNSQTSGSASRSCTTSAFASSSYW